MSDTITPEEIAAKLVGEMDFGDRDLRACISTAIREAEARGEARERVACAALLIQAIRSRKPIEASEADDTAEGYNGA